MTRIPTTPRSLWRRPVVLLSAALLLGALIAWAILSSSLAPQTAPETSAQSPAVDGADLQWPGLTGTVQAPVQSEETAPEVEAPGRTFIAKLNLQPRLKNGRVNGYVVRPDDPAILKGTPLQAGDVLLEVDGLTLDPARAALLAQNVGDYQDVFVLFERGSRTQEGMLPLGTR